MFFRILSIQCLSKLEVAFVLYEYEHFFEKHIIQQKQQSMRDIEMTYW